MGIPSPEAPIRAALIGLGNSGRHYHLPHLLAEERFALRAIATSRRAAARIPSSVRHHVGWQSILDSDDLDLVVIATPHSLHHPIAADALARGINVLIEKPMTVTVAEADDLIARARASGALLAVHHQRRWERDFQEILHVARSGEIGDVWRVTATRGHQGRYMASTIERPHAGETVVDWAHSSAEGGGVLRVIGPHPIDQVLALANRDIVTVSARISTATTESVERWAGIEIEFTDGGTGRVDVFRTLGASAPRFAVWGERGMAIAPTGERVDVHGPSSTIRSISGLEPPGVLGGEIYDDVAAALIHGTALRITASQARDVVRVIELAERSAARGEPVQV